MDTRPDGGALALVPPADAGALTVAERRTRLPTARVHRRPKRLNQTVAAVNNGAGLWARSGGRIGSSEIRRLVVTRPPSADEIAAGSPPDTVVEARGYEALTMLFEWASLDVQMELYRALARRRPWWAFLDVFGWVSGARAPVERFEELYEPGGPVELTVMGLDRGRWFLPAVFRRWFAFTVGGGDWRLGFRELAGRGGDVEAEDPLDRGYVPALLHQYREMEPAHRWRLLCALEPDVLDGPVGGALATIDPSWHDPLRFGVCLLLAPDDPDEGRRRRAAAESARRFLADEMAINPYAVDAGFDASFVAVSRRWPDVPSEPIHQFAVELRDHLGRADARPFDVVRFDAFREERHPRWPQLTPAMIARVRADDDTARFVGKRVDLWGEATDVRITEYTVEHTLTWSTEEYVGEDDEGNAEYETRTSVWCVDVPAVRYEFAVTDESGESVRALFEREGDACAIGHYLHTTSEPDRPSFAGGREVFEGTFDAALVLVL